MKARWAVLLSLAVAVFAFDASACPTRHPAVARRAHPRSSQNVVPVTNAGDFEKYNLDRINQLRAQAGLQPLVLDAQLTQFAREGSAQLMRDHVPHGHFAQSGSSMWKQGFNGAAAENQGSNTGWPRLAQDPTSNEKQQIDQILSMMMREGPGGGHHDNILNPKMKRMGIGLVEDSEGKLWMTNDFSA